MNPSSVIQYLDTVDSTMNHAREAVLHHQASHHHAVVAAAQTAGRGRLGRTWFSPPHAGLWYTHVFHIDSAIKHALPTLGLVVGVAVLQTLQEQGAQNLRIKWPNDVVTEQGKVAGILLESMNIDSNNVVLAGVGVNIASGLELALPIELQGVYCGLSDVLAQPIAAQHWQEYVQNLSVKLHERLQVCYTMWQEQGLRVFLPELQQANALLGAAVQVEGAQGTFYGTAQHIQPDGSLEVLTDTGTVRVTTGEVVRVRRQ